MPNRFITAVKRALGIPVPREKTRAELEAELRNANDYVLDIQRQIREGVPVSVPVPVYFERGEDDEDEWSECPECGSFTLVLSPANDTEGFCIREGKMVALPPLPPLPPPPDTVMDETVWRARHAEDGCPSCGRTDRREDFNSGFLFKCCNVMTRPSFTYEVPPITDPDAVERIKALVKEWTEDTDRQEGE